MRAWIVGEPVAELESGGIGRLEAEGCCDGLAGFVELAGGSKLTSEIDPGVDPFGSGLNGGTEMDDGRVGITTAVEQVAKLPLRSCKVGLELYGLFELILFSGEIAGPMEGD